MRGLIPFQKADGQVKDVDALFLFERAGVVIHGQQPLLERFRRERRLQSRVRMSLGNAVSGDRLIVGLVEVNRVTVVLRILFVRFGLLLARQEGHRLFFED